jgi:hypothetical protein
MVATAMLSRDGGSLMRAYTCRKGDQPSSGGADTRKYFSGIATERVSGPRNNEPAVSASRVRRYYLDTAGFQHDFSGEPSRPIEAPGTVAAFQPDRSHAGS